MLHYDRLLSCVLHGNLLHGRIRLLGILLYRHIGLLLRNLLYVLLGCILYGLGCLIGLRRDLRVVVLVFHHLRLLLNILSGERIINHGTGTGRNCRLGVQLRQKFIHIIDKDGAARLLRFFFLAFFLFLHQDRIGAFHDDRQIISSCHGTAFDHLGALLG